MGSGIEDEKKWYVSKTVWVNGLALVATVLQGKYGFVVSPEIQGIALTVVNLVLRKITKEKVAW